MNKELIKEFKNKLYAADKTLKWFYENYLNKIIFESGKKLTSSYFIFLINGHGKELPDSIMGKINDYLGA